jgi:nucleoid DNA-binding protein
LTKKEIVKAISDDMGLTQLKTKEIVQRTFDAIVDTLVTDGRIELRNFGVFEVKKRAARRARNPRTGDPVDVPVKFVVTFKPGKEMEERVRQLEEAEQRAQAERAQAQATAAARPEQGSAHSAPLSPMSGQNYDGITRSREEATHRPMANESNNHRSPGIPASPGTPVSPLQTTAHSDRREG